MLLETLLALTALMPRIEPAAASAWARLPALPRSAPAAPEPAPSFSLVARAVSNWRVQAGENLAPGSLAFVVRHAEEPRFVARCVRLNNYWCIKQARWSGELGGDAEGHTGFATAADSADAAVQLLRRYRRDYGRRSALAIVRRWAPAECGPARPAVSAVATGPAGRPRGPAVSSAVAPKGIGGTLRARFLARHGRGGVARAAAPAPAGSSTLRASLRSLLPQCALDGRPAPHFRMRRGRRCRCRWRRQAEGGKQLAQQSWPTKAHQHWVCCVAALLTPRHQPVWSSAGAGLAGAHGACRR